MEIVGLAVNGSRRAQSSHVPDQDGNHAIHVLELAVDFQEGLVGDGQALLFKKLAADDGVGDTGLIFEADKDVALGGAGSLAADDHAGDDDLLAMLAEVQVGGTGNVG